MKKLHTMIIRVYDSRRRHKTGTFILFADLKLIGQGDTDHIKKQVDTIWSRRIANPPVSEVEIIEIEPCTLDLITLNY